MEVVYIMVFFLEDQRIGLRTLCENDISGNYKFWLNDGIVCQYNSHHRYPVTVGELEDYVKNVYQGQGSIVLAIVIKENSEHIGNVSLQCIDYLNRTAEFAILLGEKDYWGQGIGEEAGKLIINHGFEDLGLNKIYLGTSENNMGMQRLATKLGFMKEGVRREMLYKNGKYNDVIEYGLLYSEWKEFNR